VKKKEKTRVERRETEASLLTLPFQDHEIILPRYYEALMLSIRAFLFSDPVQTCLQSNEGKRKTSGNQRETECSVVKHSPSKIMQITFLHY